MAFVSSMDDLSSIIGNIFSPDQEKTFLDVLSDKFREVEKQWKFAF